MKKSVGALAVFALLVILPSISLAQKQLTVTGVKAVGGSLRCDVICTVSGDIQKAKDFVLETYWSYEGGSHRSKGVDRALGELYEYKASKVNRSESTITFSMKVIVPGARQGRCYLKYTIDGVEMKTAEFKTPWIDVSN
jgi:hypothetical protein